jgi:hypothetical protein
LPTTPAYIVQVALLVPALVKLGVQVEAAHLFVLYFAVQSAITPPVALAVYAASCVGGVCRQRHIARKPDRHQLGGGQARFDGLGHPVHVRIFAIAVADG